MKKSFKDELCYLDDDTEIKYSCTFYVDENYGADRDGNRGQRVSWVEIDDWESTSCDDEAVEECIREAMETLGD